MDGWIGCSFLCTFLFLSHMSMVVVAKLGHRRSFVPYTHCVYGGVCQWGSSSTKCTSADVGVGKRKGFGRACPRGTNQNNQLPNYLPTLKRNEGPWDLFMRSRQRCLFAFAAVLYLAPRAADALSWCVEHTYIIVPRHHLAPIHIFIPCHGRPVS